MTPARAIRTLSYSYDNHSVFDFGIGVAKRDRCLMLKQQKGLLQFGLASVPNHYNEDNSYMCYDLHALKGII